MKMIMMKTRMTGIAVHTTGAEMDMTTMKILKTWVIVMAGTKEEMKIRPEEEIIKTRPEEEIIKTRVEEGTMKTRVEEGIMMMTTMDVIVILGTMVIQEEDLAVAEGPVRAVL